MRVFLRNVNEKIKYLFPPPHIEIILQVTGYEGLRTYVDRVVARIVGKLDGRTKYDFQTRFLAELFARLQCQLSVLVEERENRLAVLEESAEKVKHP